MKNALQIVLLSLGVAGVASAGGWTPAVPEIGASGIVSAVGLLGGVMLVMRSRRKQ